MKNQQLPAGKPFYFKIPAGVFHDEEDKDLRIELLDHQNYPLKSSSWVQFDEEKQEIYGLPLNDITSKWPYHLRATDSGGKSVTEQVELYVQQSRTLRSENHEIYIGLKLINNYRSNVDWQIRLIRAIAEVLNEPTTNNILVREIRSGVQDSNHHIFVYSNETIPKDLCQEDEIENILKVLTVPALSKSLAHEMVIKSIHKDMIGACKKVNHTKTDTQIITKNNIGPMPRNAVDAINATVGQLLVFKVPEDTFFDSDKLTLKLLTADRTQIHPKNWLQFDSKNEEFYGIPKKENEGQREYVLVAEDAGGLSANDALVVSVKPSTRKDYSVAFELTLKVHGESFNALQQRLLVEQILKIFNDSVTSHIQIRPIRHSHNQNYTVFSFFNTTIFRQPNQPCPDDEIEVLKNIWVSSDGSFRRRVTEHLADFNVTNISFIPYGTCQGYDTIRHEPNPIIPDEPAANQDDYLLTFALPAVIILAMLLLASIVACYLHRRRLTGKMELGDEEERKSFRSKGIPVIFQDELDEKPEIGNKSPIILKDEKPPLLPPSYNSTNPDGK